MRSSTRSPERRGRRLRHLLLVPLLALALQACAPAESSLSLDQARIDQRGGVSVLVVECDWRPSGAMLDALDHGIPLTLELDLTRERRGLLGWQVQQRELHRLELRYFPLSRNYQLRDLDRATVRSFGVRAAALAALSRMELPLSGTTLRAVAPERQRLRIVLDSTALPGALRLPALVDPAWRQAEVERTWPGTPAA
ncbi:DUF4390 domain-containing protein [Tahibacter caeni]|uniref:DUF4390 domain-containing protein n=1 Tax=Tahibacter caeni TaxID=1453545 RepID=UPI00214789C5|nr:DUF4390 domain-containing protein [Tahibacter caeni]